MAQGVTWHAVDDVVAAKRQALEPRPDTIRALIHVVRGAEPQLSSLNSVFPFYKPLTCSKRIKQR